MNNRLPQNMFLFSLEDYCDSIAVEHIHQILTCWFCKNMKSIDRPLYIVWSEDMDTGIPIIDEQHRGLVSLINTFFYHKGDADKDIDRFLVPTAEMFKSYAQLHFLTISRLMKETEYPESDLQTKRNEELMSIIQTVDMRCRSRRDAEGFLRFLKMYWTKIVSQKNHNFIKHLNSQQ
ncbi:MAG: hypothetical protein PHI96_06640 [Desulfovibrio sp.]|nr:hypothetical protein [Desulfovibrio sp.]